MAPLDFGALGVFVVCWLALEPALGCLNSKSSSITANMSVIRAAWMRRMLQRNFLLVDAQIIGHTINSASFFGSANLLVIIGIGGAVFSASDAPLGGIELHGTKTLLLLAPLMRGLFDFIWSVRQLNYFLASMAASPLPEQQEEYPEWSSAMAALLDRSLGTFSQGVRNYYFAFAASLWLLGPVALASGALGATAFLIWRQTLSPTAKLIRQLAPLARQDLPPKGRDQAAASAIEAP